MQEIPEYRLDPDTIQLMRMLKEPLFHFLILAALLFVLEHFFGVRQKEQIIVDRQTAEYLVKQREDLELRKLDPEEREQTIAAYIEDEILYNEAYKRGLDRSDSRMRRDLIRKIRGILTSDLREPTDEELRAFYDNNTDRFTNPATTTLDHVFFADPATVPADVLEQLRAGVSRGNSAEQTLALAPSIDRASQRMLVAIFGADTARGIIAINDDEWHGPFVSPQGVHFVRVTDRSPARQLPFAAVQQYLAAQWSMEEARRIVDNEIAAVKDGYEIIVEDSGGTAE